MDYQEKIALVLERLKATEHLVLPHETEVLGYLIKLLSFNTENLLAVTVNYNDFTKGLKKNNLSDRGYKNLSKQVVNVNKSYQNLSFQFCNLILEEIEKILKVVESRKQMVNLVQEEMKARPEEFYI